MLITHCNYCSSHTEGVKRIIKQSIVKSSLIWDHVGVTFTFVHFVSCHLTCTFTTWLQKLYLQQDNAGTSSTCERVRRLPARLWYLLGLSNWRSSHRILHSIPASSFSSFSFLREGKTRWWRQQDADGSTKNNLTLSALAWSWICVFATKFRLRRLEFVRRGTFHRPFLMWNRSQFYLDKWMYENTFIGENYYSSISERLK